MWKTAGRKQRAWRDPSAVTKSGLQAGSLRDVMMMRGSEGGKAGGGDKEGWGRWGGVEGREGG